MITEYKVAYYGGEFEIVEKKSRFIATVKPIESEEDAIAFIEQLKKKNWNATHNCYAYVLGQKNEIQRFSDDGEPQGTAGKPILDVLLGEEVHNVAVVVTRYFGGTLLGTGGLVRAYSKSAKAGLEHSTILTKQLGKKLLLTMDYNNVGKLQYILAQMQIDTIDSVYKEDVLLYVVVPVDKLDTLVKKVMEATSATATMEELQTVYYATLDGKIITFDKQLEGEQKRWQFQKIQ